MTDLTPWIHALRSSHDRLTRLVAPLDDRGVIDRSYASEWSIADVLSHLGSQAEIYGAYLAAGLTGDPAPGNDSFGPVWDRWNALPATEQVAESLRANEAFLTRLEQVTDDQRESFSVSMFGMDTDLAGLAGMRLSEHALHTWDVAVALDRDATLAPDAVELLVDLVGRIAAHAGSPVDDAAPVTIETSDPARTFAVSLSPTVQMVPTTPVDGPDEPAASLHLPAEALIRLVYGRLDPEHTPEGAADVRLTLLRSAFSGL